MKQNDRQLLISLPYLQKIFKKTNPKFSSASTDKELEHLKELLAEAEELCLLLALEKHLEEQRAEREIKRFSIETGSGGMMKREKDG